jgi:hypothetical protein
MPSAGIRHGGGHLGIADAMHAALDDRMFNSEEFGYARSHQDSIVTLNFSGDLQINDRRDGREFRTAR